jgi:transposase-like protein
MIDSIQILEKDNSINQTGSSEFIVRSQTNEGTQYRVSWQLKKWVCTCPDFLKHKRRCKHIYAVNTYQMLKQISQGIRETEIDRTCPRCGSRETTKRAWRFNRSMPKQIYFCKKCKKKFSGTLGFARMKKEPQAIVLALDLYFKGLSLRKITEHLSSIYSIKATHVTVYNWIRKYVKLIKKYVDSEDSARLSNRWHADETVLRLKGSQINMWALLDDELKLLIASRISESREAKQAECLFEKGMKKAKNEPLEIVTDGLPSYEEAIGNLASKYGNPVIHLKGPFASPLNNNRMERFFNTVKERTKQFRGLYSESTTEQFVDGFSLYYNHVRPHSALNGRTPAEAAGLKPHLENNKWLHLIRLATKKEKIGKNSREDDTSNQSSC